MNACFNCGTDNDVHPYSFDLDLPTIVGCRMCVFALSMGDEDMLKDLRPRTGSRRKRDGGHNAGVKESQR